MFLGTLQKYKLLHKILPGQTAACNSKHLSSLNIGMLCKIVFHNAPYKYFCVPPQLKLKVSEYTLLSFADFVITLAIRSFPSNIHLTP